MVLSTRAFRAIALATLLPAAAVVYRLSPTTIAWLTPVSPDTPVAIAALAVALTALAATVVWALVLLPLRARSELQPLGQELAEIRARGGLAAALAAERQKVDQARESADPAVRRGYHAKMAGAGLFVTALAWLVAWILWSEDVLMLESALFAAVAPFVTVWYAGRYVVSRVCSPPR